jgi:UDP-N-acetylglucosamine:LPS N-acetylglucosamine transferase
MVLICGPGIEPDALDVPEVDVRGYVPRLYEHLAASDLAVVQAGGTTTLELTALQRPFVYFPVEGQREQEIVVAGRLARHRAGIRMSRATATPADLARTISENLDADVDHASIPLDGAERIADIVLERTMNHR